MDVGARSRGSKEIDLRRPMTDDDFGALLAAWHEHLVVLVRRTGADRSPADRRRASLRQPAARPEQREQQQLRQATWLDFLKSPWSRTSSRTARPWAACGYGEAYWPYRQFFHAKHAPAASLLHAIEGTHPVAATPRSATCIVHTEALRLKR